MKRRSCRQFTVCLLKKEGGCPRTCRYYKRKKRSKRKAMLKWVVGGITTYYRLIGGKIRAYAKYKRKRRTK